MDSNEGITINKIKVQINRGDPDTGDDSVLLIFPGLDNLEVALSDSTVEDIKSLFDSVFEYISTHKALIEFELDDEENDLFNHVSQDVIDQLNAEIKESEEDFVRIWELTSSDEAQEKV